MSAATDTCYHLRSQQIRPGMRVEAAGLLSEDGRLVAVGPIPMATGEPLTLPAALILTELPASVRTGLITASGEWTGTTIAHPRVVPGRDEWFWSDPPHVPDDAATGEWGDIDLDAASRTCPMEGLLASGRSQNVSGVVFVTAEFAQVTPESLVWQERYPDGMIRAYAWVHPDC